MTGRTGGVSARATPLRTQRQGGKGMCSRPSTQRSCSRASTHRSSASKNDAYETSLGGVEVAVSHRSTSQAGTSRPGTSRPGSKRTSRSIASSAGGDVELGITGVNTGRGYTPINTQRTAMQTARSSAMKSGRSTAIKSVQSSVMNRSERSTASGASGVARERPVVPRLNLNSKNTASSSRSVSRRSNQPAKQQAAAPTVVEQLTLNEVPTEHVDPIVEHVDQIVEQPIMAAPMEHKETPQHVDTSVRKPAEMAQETQVARSGRRPSVHLDSTAMKGILTGAA